MDEVAPPAGAWIETRGREIDGGLPLRVAPPAGAWIETGHERGREDDVRVAPPAGAWIETSSPPVMAVESALGLSRPLRARGLKREHVADDRRAVEVTPPVGV